MALRDQTAHFLHSCQLSRHPLDFSGLQTMVHRFESQVLEIFQGGKVAKSCIQAQAEGVRQNIIVPDVDPSVSLGRVATHGADSMFKVLVPDLEVWTEGQVL